MGSWVGGVTNLELEKLFELFLKTELLKMQAKNFRKNEEVRGEGVSLPQAPPNPKRPYALCFIMIEPIVIQIHSLFKAFIGSTKLKNFKE